MKLFHIKNIDDFFRTIDKCTGKVELVGDDIRLNLKSKLAQYFSIASIFSSGNEVPELELICYNQHDVDLIVDYMMNDQLQ